MKFDFVSGTTCSHQFKNSRTMCAIVLCASAVRYICLAYNYPATVFLFVQTYYFISYRIIALSH